MSGYATNSQFLSLLTRLRPAARIPQLLLFALVAGGTAEAADIVAKAGAFELTAADVRTLLSGLPEQTRTAFAGDPKALEQYVRSELLRRAVIGELRASGFEKQSSVATQIDRVREEALMRLWIGSKAMPAASFPAEEAVRAAYESNKSAFAAPTEYRIAQIFISAPNGADAAQTAAAMKKAAELGAKIGGSDFAALARSQSDHPESASKGGDLGFLPDNRLLPEIAAAVKTMGVNQTTGPVKTSQGLHYLKLLEKKPGAVPGYAAVREAIVNALKEKQAQQLEQVYLAELNNRLAVSINQIELAKLQQVRP